MLQCTANAPRPYRDELHFGYFGRLRTYWLTPTANDLNRHLRGGTQGHASVDLLGLSGSLVRSLAAVGIEAEHLVWQNTLLPYYLAFQSEGERAKLVANIETASLMGLHFRMGVGSSSVKHPRYFRYCPACWRSEVAELGEVYVKRLFQLPGVLVCPEHDEPLCDTAVLFRPLASRAYWNFTPADATLSGDFEPTSVREAELARLLALDARRLLLQGALVHPRAECLASDYHRALQHLGLASRNVHPVTLESAFLDLYPMHFLRKLGLAFEPGRESNWLRCFTRKTSRRFHPLQHILFRRFAEHHLGSDCWAWMAAAHWPCLSPMQPHPGPEAVTVIRLYFDACRDVWEGIFACHCGCRYSGGGIGYPSAASLHLHRIIAHSPHLHRRVAELARAGGTSTAIARQVRLHRKTVQDWLKAGDERKTLSKSEAVMADRKAWLSLVGENPRSTLKQLRILAPALFSRLYAHDATWLKSVPLWHQPYQSRVRRDYWQRRDKALAQQVGSLAEEIRRRIPAVRVTLSRIGRELGVLNLFRKKLMLLPVVAETLTQFVETVEAFQLRRLERALEQSPTWVSRRAMMKAAGLRPQKTRPGVMLVIDRLLSGGEQR